MRFSELRQKQVIDVKTGKMLGYIQDLCIQNSYQVDAFYIYPPVSCMKRILPWFFATEEICISIHQIVQIGEDVILVEHA